MAELDKSGIVTQEELMISSLVMGAAVAELLIERGLLTRDEFMQKLSAMRGAYQRIWQEAKKGTIK